MKINLAIICYFLSMPVFFAQVKIQPELRKVSQAYFAAQNFSMNVTVVMYKDKNDKKGSVVGNGYMKRAGKNYYSSFGKDEMLSNSKGTFIIDNESKNITYLEPENTQVKITSQLPDIDSLILLNDSVVYKGEDSDSKHFCFYNSESYIDQTDIYVSKTNSFIKRIIYHYVEGTEQENFEMDKLVIDYTNIKLEEINTTVFSENKYVKIDAKGITPVGTYQKYQLILSENE